MKHLNNSQPLAVATQYAPLSTSMHIVVKGGLSTVQFYKQNQQEWLPDHTHAERYNDIGALVDGPLTLRAEYSIIDKDGLIRDGDLVPQVYWFVDGKRITDTDKEKDFYMNRRTDSLNYQYNSLGQLIGWTGKSHTEEGVCDILVRCQSNGVPEEFTEIWLYDQYDEVADTWMPVQYTHRTFYDSRGNISRKEIPNLPVIEYDYDYWGQ